MLYEGLTQLGQLPFIYTEQHQTLEPGNSTAAPSSCATDNHELFSDRFLYPTQTAGYEYEQC